MTSKLAVIATTVMAARLLTPGRFATYVGLLAAAHLGAAAWDAGVSTLVSVERSGAHAPLSRLANRVLRARLQSFPGWLAAFALASWVLGATTGATVDDIMPFALASLLVSTQQPILAALRADLHFSEASFALFAGRWLTVGTLGCALALGFGSRGVALVGISHVLGESCVVIAAVMSLRHHLGDGDPEWDERRVRLRTALPYAANSLLSIAYNRLDILLVAVLVPAAQLAAYAPASRIQDALYFLPSAIAAVALPYLSRQASGPDAARWRTMRRLWLLGLLISVPSAIVLTFFMPAVLDLVLGPMYGTAASPSRILVWSMPLSVIGATLLAYLISRGRGIQTTTAFAAAGVVSLTLHLILDPRFGATGAAAASLARDAANLAVAGLLIWRARGPDKVRDPDAQQAMESATVAGRERL